MADYPAFRARSRGTWRAWLSRNHQKSSGIWLVFPKKASGLATISYNDAVEEALCFGWIDGLLRPIDDTYYKQMFTPRKPKSAWAPSNKARVERLVAQRLMTPAGLAAIEMAKANGSWTTYDAAASLKMPAPLRAALSANARAQKRWPLFTDSQRRQFLYWLASAKRDETRARRIAEIVSMVSKGIRPSLASERSRRAEDVSRSSGGRATSRARRPPR